MNPIIRTLDDALSSIRAMRCASQTERTQLDECEKIIAAQAVAHPSVAALRATITRLTNDNREKAAAIRSQEAECTRLREACADAITAKDEALTLANKHLEMCDQAERKNRQAVKERVNAEEGMANNARRLVAVVEIMDGLAKAAHALLSNYSRDTMNDLRAALAKVPGPRDNLPLAPDVQAGTECPNCKAMEKKSHDRFDELLAALAMLTMEQLETLRQRKRAQSRAGEAPPARCTCPYPLPTTAYGYEVHWAHCPAKAAHVHKKSPEHGPWESRAEVNPATMPEATDDRYPVTKKDTDERLTCLRCGIHVGWRHLDRCPWNLANR